MLRWLKDVLNKKNVMQNNDSLKITQNSDGTFAAEWDKNDPNWKFMNGLTSREIQCIIQEAIRQDQNGK